MLSRRSLLLLTGAGFVRAAPGDDRRFALRVFRRINEIREKNGAPALGWSEAVAECAREQSRRKVELRFPGHNDPERGDVAQRLTAAGIHWMQCGENIFMERGYTDPVNYAVVSWWYSEGHRMNLLDPEYTLTGVGLAEARDKTWYATQIFVTPLLTQQRQPPVRSRHG
ncbi:MAG TPA: CAP domain-containing protein [Bryobacteraceae bacterium]|jgi:uncharacterized protein YkwD|nr:CAP domain-containing protein [Bryobacteraceae bacterium]